MSIRGSRTGNYGRYNVRKTRDETQEPLIRLCTRQEYSSRIANSQNLAMTGEPPLGFPLSSISPENLINNDLKKQNNQVTYIVCRSKNNGQIRANDGARPGPTHRRQ